MTGATSDELEPTNTFSPITVRDLFDPVIVAGDGSGADIGLRPDVGVADIGQVIDLGALADIGLLDLDEVAHLGAIGQLRLGAQPGERTDRGPRPDGGALDVAEGVDHRALADTTPGPKTTLGSITTSRPISVSQEK